MSIHLTVVSYRERLDSFLLDILLALDNTPPHKATGCQELSALPVCVVNAGLDVTLLDLVGHGAQSQFQLGEVTVFDGEQEVPEVFTQLNPVLPKNAIVRLLGCKTGGGEQGLKMLKRVSEALEGREIFGTTTEIFASDFDAQGLKATFPAKWLISSKSTQAVLSSSRMEPTAPAPEASLRWMDLLPGYQPVGRERPLVFPNLHIDYQGTQVSFAEGGQLVLIHDEFQLPPLMMRWSETGPVPPLNERLQPFGVH